MRAPSGLFFSTRGAPFTRNMEPSTRRAVSKLMPLKTINSDTFNEPCCAYIHVAAREKDTLAGHWQGTYLAQD
jgi:hypothetical protein